MKTVVIIGAGPAGLTAAYELQQAGGIKAIVFELEAQVGGISRTINYKGNRMDLGGHRFFSKSDWVMNWWQKILPVQATSADVGEDAAALRLTYQGSSRDFTPAIEETGTVGGGSSGYIKAQDPDAVMMVRSRLSRIFYRRRLFDYPLKLNAATLKNLGLIYTAQIGIGYIWARLFQRKPEKTLEDFLINRFGNTLYRTFFKDYTEKVWGVECSQISAEWGAQRIKGLSLRKALLHAITKPFKGRDTAQKSTETSLVERFLYPKLGPGQMWEHVAAKVEAAGGDVHLKHRVVGIEREGQQIIAVNVRNETGEVRRVECDQLISTMPVKELAQLLGTDAANQKVLDIASRLPYRDYLTAGLLVRRMLSKYADSANGMPPDNWIYIQEPDVKLGRLQVFNNWSPSLVADPDTIWLGLEYFCDEGDGLWSMEDAAFLKFAAGELAKIGLIDERDVLDGTVVRVPKAYPAYFGAYSEMGQVREWLDTFPNLFPVGRNGMHRYNNQDHSMLAAKAAVDCIVSGTTDKSALWAVNVDDEYHETAKTA